MNFNIIILGFGSYTAYKMDREAFPDVDFDIVSIKTIYPGAPAENVESYVTNIIEDEVKNISGIDKIESTSYENLSLVILKITPVVEQPST